jgi:hypothetical protein
MADWREKTAAAGALAGEGSEEWQDLRPHRRGHARDDFIQDLRLDAQHQQRGGRLIGKLGKHADTGERWQGWIDHRDAGSIYTRR